MSNTVDVPDILEAFKYSLHAEDASSNTTSAYLSDLAHFVSWYTQTYCDFHIDEITPSDIRAYREFLQDQIPPTAPATINRRLAALRRFFSWGRENHLTEFQPSERIRNVESVTHGPKSLDRNHLTANSGIVLSVMSSKPEGYRGDETAVFCSCCIIPDYVPESWRHFF